MKVRGFFLSMLVLFAGVVTAPLPAQSLAITIPNGNNLYQVTNSVTGVSYAINKISNSNVELLVIQPNGTYTTQQFTLPSGYILGGRGARIDLNAGGTVSLSLTESSTGLFKVAQYSAFNVSTPTILSAPDAGVFASSSSGRIVGQANGMAAEILPGGGYVAAPGQLGGTATTAWEGANGFGYAGFITSASTFRQESFIFENGLMYDPFASLNYESAYIGSCSRFGMFCFGNVTDPLAGDQMFSVDRMTGLLTGFVDQSGANFYASYFAGAREDGWIFGKGSSGLFAANHSIWGNVVKPFDTYCLGYLIGVNCSAFQDLNAVNEYFDTNTSKWRSNFAALGSFVSVNAPSGDPIYSSVATPEPATVALLGTGLAAIGGVARRRRNRKSVA